MKANELRIGNLVYRTKEWGEKIDTKVMAWDEAIWYDIGDCVAYLEDFEPIPLTEEWLLRFGFDKHRSTRNLLFDYVIYFERQQNSLYLCNNQTKVQYVIEWVHEAQNIYFALTGEELTIS